MIRTWAPLLLLLSLSPAYAREPKKAPPKEEPSGFGLDLTKDEPSPPPASESGTGTSSTSAPSTAPAPDAAPGSATTAEAQQRTAEEALATEREITQDDRVKSVQRKVYLKRHRFELAPFISVSVNDPYYTKFGGMVRGSYYLADTLAVALRGAYFQVVPTDDVRTAKGIFQSRIAYSVPIWMLLADVEWSPIYGKATIFNSIIHFDGYILGGLGTAVTESSPFPGRPAADLGIGLRFVVKDFLAVNVAGINTTYVDTPAGTTKGATQNMLTLNAGVSIFFPFRSTGREGE